jgi:hypothetical protein
MFKKLREALRAQRQKRRQGPTERPLSQGKGGKYDRDATPPEQAQSHFPTGQVGGV